MPPQSKAARLSTVDEALSGSEDDLALAHVNATMINSSRAPAKTKTAATKRAATTKATGKTATKRKAPAAKTTRTALKDKTNIATAPDEEGEESDDGSKPSKAKRAKTTATATAAAKRKKAAAKDVADEPQVQIVPETQPEADEEVSQSIEMDVDPVGVNAQYTTEPFVQRPHSATLQPLVQRPSARSTSVQPLQPRPSARSYQNYPAPRERSGSVSDTGRGSRRGGEAELRRKLNEMTKKYEDASVRYESLQQLGQEEAESNFEKLKRATERKAQDADNLIASLKKEIAELRKLSAPAPTPAPAPAPVPAPKEKDNSEAMAALQKQIADLKSKNTSLTTERDEGKKTLQTAQNENKSLEAKLVAARQQLSASAAQEAKEKELQGRAVASNAPEGLKELKMKENLYSDLTGLLIRSVKRKDGEDEYDCIQTGRNGTLHFHLTVANDSAHINPQTPSGLSWEDAEFAYDPFLDERRDHALLDILPEYLTDGICFPRSDAVKFYSKILESMTKKIVVEDS